MFSPNAAVTKAKFSATYYKDPRFQINHSVTFLDNAVEVSFSMSPIYTTISMKFSV